jgi:prepilin-type N-terminal cleavage/methylation domain-containing protein/prepilin-type processing-associated H-X9-DG protein
MRRAGFTLIELLVVVAIIAVLIAILLPSLGRAKSNAIRVQCAANLSQWGKVITMYQQENQDWFGARERIDSKHKLFWNTIAFNNEPSLYDNEWSADLNVGGKITAEFRTCPGDPKYGQIKGWGASSDNMGKAVGAANRPAVDYAMPLYHPTPGAPSDQFGLWKVTQFNHPGTTCLLLDGPPNVQGATATSNMANLYAFDGMGDLDMSYAPTETVANALQERHLGLGNVLFLDSHVEQHNYQDYCANIPQGSVPDTTYDLNTAPDSTKHWIDMQQ